MALHVVMGMTAGSARRRCSRIGRWADRCRTTSRLGSTGHPLPRAHAFRKQTQRGVARGPLPAGPLRCTSLVETLEVTASDGGRPISTPAEAPVPYPPAPAPPTDA